MVDLDLQQYMGAYIDGSKENLDLMDRMLLAMEQNAGNIEAIEEIFRAAHTLKGMSATMGFEKIAHLTHEMESVLDRLRSRKLSVTPQIIDVLFETFDVLRNLVTDSFNQADSRIDPSEIAAKLNDIASGRTPSDSPPQEAGAAAGDTVAGHAAYPEELAYFGLNDAEQAAMDEVHKSGILPYLLRISLVPDCLLKGPRIFMVLRTLEAQQCEIFKSIPEVKDLENEKFDRSFIMIVTTNTPGGDVCDAIETISEIEKAEMIFIPSRTNPAAAPEPKPEIPEPEYDLEPAAEPVPVSEPEDEPVPEPENEPEPVSEPEAEAEVIIEPEEPEPVLPPSPPPPPPPPPPRPRPVQQQAPQVPQRPPARVQSKPAVPAAPAKQPVKPQPQESFQIPGGAGLPPGDGGTPPSDAETEEQKEVVELAQLVSFQMDGETYALEIKQVEGIINVLPMTRVPKSPPHIEGVINLRGEILPVINLRRRLKLVEKADIREDQIMILSFEREKVKVGFLVDRVLEVLRLPQTAIEPPSHVSEGVNVEHLRGVGKLGSKIIILLNAEKIIFG